MLANAARCGTGQRAAFEAVTQVIHKAINALGVGGPPFFVRRRSHGLMAFQGASTRAPGTLAAQFEALRASRH